MLCAYHDYQKECPAVYHIWPVIKRCFQWNVKEKTRKNRKNTSGFWRPAVIDRTTFVPVSDVEKLPFWQLTFGKGLIWRVKAFNNWQGQFLIRNRRLNNESKSKFGWLLSVCKPIWFCLGAPSASTVGFNSRISPFQRSAFSSNGLASSFFIFGPISLRFFPLINAKAKKVIILCCYGIFNVDLRKNVMLCQIQPGRVEHMYSFGDFLSISRLL